MMAPQQALAADATSVFHIAGHDVDLSGNLMLDRHVIKHGPLSEECVKYSELRAQGRDFDVVITAGDKSISAHKAILTARVPYFRGLFDCDMAESRNGEVSLMELEFEAVDALMGYAYTGAIVLEERSVFDVMVAANYLHMESVTDECVQFIRKRLRVATALPLLIACRRMGCHKMDAYLHTFINKNLYSISQTPEFGGLSVDEVEPFLRSDSLYVDSEKQVFDMINRWIGQDEDKLAHAARLMRAVRCTFMTAAEVEEVADTMRWTTRIAECKQLLLEAARVVTTPGPRRRTSASFDTRERRCDHAHVLIFPVGEMPCAPQQSTRVSPMSFYDAVSDTWTTCKSMPVVRGRNGVVVIGKQIYALGGANSNLRMATCSVYDTEKDKWSEIPAMREVRASMATGVIAGKIFVAGGWNDKEALITAEMYDPDRLVWAGLPPMKEKRSTPASCVYNGKLYVIGGHDGMRIHKDGAIYDPETNQWLKMAPMSKRRCRFGAAVLNGYIYVVGGYDGAAFLRDAERYDPATDTWTSIHETSERRSRSAVAVSCGRLFVFGGFNGLINLQSVEMYLPEADKWIPRASMTKHSGGVFLGAVPVPATYPSPVANLEADDVC